MGFIEHVFTPRSCLGKKLKCDGCGHRFKRGEPYFSKMSGNPVGVVGHYCRKCYDGFYIDV